MERLKKIDIHAHAVSTKSLMRDDGQTYCTPKELLAMYDQIGIERGVLLPMVSPEAQYELNTNREILEIVKEYPDRFSWFCNVDPRQGNNTESADLSYFLEFFKVRGARGVGEISANMPFDHPMVMNLFYHCEKCGMPVLFHIGLDGNDYGLIDDMRLTRLEKVLKTFPNLRVIGHSQKFWATISGDVTEDVWTGYPKGKVVPGGRLVELMRTYPNLCTDLSAGSGYNAITRDPEFGCAFIEEFQDRIYYGTDICAPENITNPMLKLAAFLDDAMENGRISYDAYRKVSRDNLLKLLKI